MHLVAGINHIGPGREVPGCLVLNGVHQVSGCGLFESCSPDIHERMHTTRCDRTNRELPNYGVGKLLRANYDVKNIIPGKRALSDRIR